MKQYTPATSGIFDCYSAAALAINEVTGNSNAAEVLINPDNNGFLAFVVRDKNGNPLFANAAAAVADLGISQAGHYTWNGGTLTRTNTSGYSPGSSSNIVVWGNSNTFVLYQTVGSGSSQPIFLAVCGYNTDNCRAFQGVGSQNNAASFYCAGFPSEYANGHVVGVGSSRPSNDMIPQLSFGSYPLFVDKDFNDVSDGIISSVFLVNGSPSAGSYRFGEDTYYYATICSSYLLIKDSLV